MSAETKCVHCGNTFANHRHWWCHNGLPVCNNVPQRGDAIVTTFRTDPFPAATPPAPAEPAMRFTCEHQSPHQPEPCALGCNDPALTNEEAWRYGRSVAAPASSGGPGVAEVEAFNALAAEQGFHLPYDEAVQRGRAMESAAAPASSEGATHELKVWSMYADALESGVKTFEFRKDDRTPRFEVGDTLRLREWGGRANDYKGREWMRRVTYVARGGVIPEGFCVMSVVPSASSEGAEPSEEVALQAAYQRALSKPFGENTWEERYATLAMAVRDTDFDCDDACSSLGHEDNCFRRNDAAYMLAVLQARLLASEAARAGAERERDEWVGRCAASDIDSLNLNAQVAALRSELEIVREAAIALLNETDTEQPGSIPPSLGALDRLRAALAAPTSASSPEL